MSHEDAQAAVLLVLETSETARIDFHWGSRHVTPRLYRQVQEAIAAGHIEVRHAPRASSSSYFSEDEQDRIVLKRTETDTVVRRAMIVHEATHAGCDLRRWDMTVGDSEAIAYLAQCIYARAQTENPVDVRLMSANPHGDDVFYQAWDMAGDVLDRGVNRWTEEADHLLFLVEGHPWYEESAGDMAGVSGTPGFARCICSDASFAVQPRPGCHRRSPAASRRHRNSGREYRAAGPPAKSSDRSVTTGPLPLVARLCETVNGP